jgi:hypothetical protein
MSESKKLIALRDKLVWRRRAIVDSLQTAVVELLNGDDIMRIQDTIDAVDRAIADELLAESKDENSLRGNSLRGERRDRLPAIPIDTNEV